MIPCQAHIVSIVGPDAMAFAHAQFSSPVDTLAIGHWQWSAWLDAHARVRAFFHLVRRGEHELVLLLRGGTAQNLAAELRRFVFRSRVTIAADAPATLAGRDARPLHTTAHAREGLVLGCGDHSLEVGTHEAGDARWMLPELCAGWPWLPDAALSRWLAPALSLQRLQATVLGKGCYPGQEIIARLHFRAGHRRHLCRIALPSRPDAGADLVVDGRVVGQVLAPVIDQDGLQALAVVDDPAESFTHDGRPDIQTSAPGFHVLQRWIG